MKKIIAVCISLSLVLTSCAGPVGLNQTKSGSYSKNLEGSSFYLNMDDSMKAKSFAQELAVVPLNNNLLKDFEKQVSAALLINNDTNEVIIEKASTQKIYPASITKIMTALLILKYGDLKDKVTLKEDITFDEDNVIIVNLKKGDTITVDALLNTLLVTSANDCAIALARYLSDNEEKFVDLMNKEAKALGATGTHFVNPHGLHNDNHYTTAYDLYLIFREVTKYSYFNTITEQPYYVLRYINADNNPVETTVMATNHYLSENQELPDNVTLVGTKTGTTAKAGSCLIMLTANSKGEEFISVVIQADNKPILYDAMTNLLNRINN